MCDSVSAVRKLITMPSLRGVRLSGALAVLRCEAVGGGRPRSGRTIVVAAALACPAVVLSVDCLYCQIPRPPWRRNQDLSSRVHYRDLFRELLVPCWGRSGGLLSRGYYRDCFSQLRGGGSRGSWVGLCLRCWVFILDPFRSSRLIVCLVDMGVPSLGCSQLDASTFGASCKSLSHFHVHELCWGF